MKQAFILITAALFLITPLLFADPVELIYDTGEEHGSFRDLDESNMEAVCFSPAHPCSLLSVRLYLNCPESGTIELHVWGDNGAHEPDQNNDLIDPIDVEVESSIEGFEWTEVDLSEAGLIFDPPQDFHIGHVCSEGGATILTDTAHVVFEQRSHLWSYNDNLRTYLWHNLGNNGNYMVRATVEYFDEIEEFPFVNVSEDIGLAGLGNHAWGDYNNDGWEDLLQGGRTLYQNQGDGTFENVSRDAGIVADNPAGTGTWGDFDNDGWLDFFAGNSRNDQEDRLYHNNGDGTFDFANEEYWFFYGYNPTAGCGWGDADGDGCLELYIANSEYIINDNFVYFRDYFFTFDPDPDVRVFCEITPSELRNLRYYGRSVAWCDFDMDNDMDVYISNYRLQRNFLWVNRGDLEFENEAAERGGLQGYNQSGAYGHTIGSAWADFDNDLDFDLLVGNFAHPWGLAYQDKIMLCRNSGYPDYTFEDIRVDSGIEYCETVFCPAWGDYNNNGLQDLFISAVYPGRQPFMYRNNGDGTFDNINYETGFQANCYNSSGVTWCDYDHDGDLDLAVGGGMGGLFQNNSETGHWLQIEARGVAANKFGFGTQATVHCGDDHYLRQVEGGTGSQGCQNMTAMHFGLGENESCDSLIVTWVGGDTDRYYNVEIDKRWYAIQGEGLFEDIYSSVPSHKQMPTDFTISNPYPNPFNSSINLDFTTARNGNVKVEVFDLSGRLVDVIADDEFTVGQHSLTWQAGNIPAGSYLVQVKHSNGIISRMVTLVK
ncbi:MAG: VCBS repeat-containing protein [Calditrichaeota bacterium]|nr:VCBS repeat-containing protein [Calditrichota bacterium]